jgi:hypothetical protein
MIKSQMAPAFKMFSVEWGNGTDLNDTQNAMTYYYFFFYNWDTFKTGFRKQVIGRPGLISLLLLNDTKIWLNLVSCLLF